MTDEAPPRRRIRPPGPFAVVAAASGAFFALVGAFAIQERVAAPEPVAAAPREIVHRRVVLTRIVVHERGTARAPAATTTSSAPAPAPAPLITRTS